MSHALDSVWEKLKRADENIVNLEREIGAFLEESAYAVIPNDDPEVVQEALKAHANRIIPMRFSILSGEIIHQLRSYLDHIAWQLSPQERRDSTPTAIEFPIFLTKPADKKTIDGYERKVKGISDCGLRLIESLQPYHRAPAMLTGPVNHPLWIIHDLDRIDKHRELIVTMGAFNVAADWEADLYLMLHREADFPEEHIASLGRAFDPNSKITTQISFREFGGRKVYPVVPGLIKLTRAVQDIALTFSRECFLMSPFQGCRDRIERARAHSKALSETWNNFIQEDPYFPVVDMEDDGTGTVSVFPSAELPASCSLELGELLYQLRSALDGAIYQAAIIESGQDPPPGEKNLEFPLCFTEAEFGNAARKIKPLSQQCRTFIESVQPYKTPENLPPQSQIICINRSLGILNDWARKDRHRQLHIIGSWVSDASPLLRFPPGVSIEFMMVSGDGFLENNREIAKFRLAGYIPGMKVQANPNLMIDIAVDEIPKPVADNDTIRNRIPFMIETVAAIINKIEDLTGSGSAGAVR